MNIQKLKDIKESIKNEWEIILSGIALIQDSKNYTKRMQHGISNQEYEQKCIKATNDIAAILIKMKVYESVLADTWRARLLIKANKMHKALLNLKDDKKGLDKKIEKR